MYSFVGIENNVALSVLNFLDHRHQNVFVYA